MLSKKRLDAIAGFEAVCDAAESGATLSGVVTEVVKGGVLALTNGVKVFIPASQATMSRADNLEDLLKKEVEFKILEVNRQRRRAVASIKAVLKEQRKVLEDRSPCPCKPFSSCPVGIPANGKWWHIPKAQNRHRERAPGRRINRRPGAFLILWISAIPPC